MHLHSARVVVQWMCYGEGKSETESIFPHITLFIVIHSVIYIQLYTQRRLTWESRGRGFDCICLKFVVESELRAPEQLAHNTHAPLFFFFCHPRPLVVTATATSPCSSPCHEPSPVGGSDRSVTPTALTVSRDSFATHA